jgi:predicted DNA-binding protein
MKKATSESSVRNFHVPLPEVLYRRLHREAKERRQSATQVARTAIEAWLKSKERLRVAEEIQAYAVSVAGTAEDFDPDLEAAALADAHRWSKDR